MNSMCTLIALYFHLYLIRLLRAREKAQVVGALAALAEGWKAAVWLLAPLTGGLQLLPGSKRDKVLSQVHPGASSILRLLRVLPPTIRQLITQITQIW